MIKFVIRWLFRLLILAIVLVVALLLLKDVLLKALLEYQIRAATGMEAKISRVEAHLGAPVLSVEGVRIYNTAEFGGSPFLDMPELYLEYDRKALTGDRLHFKLIRLNLAELNLVKNQAGKTNLNEVMTRLANLDSMNSKDGKPVPMPGPSRFDGIDTLNLTLGKLRMTDLKDPSKSRDFEMGLKDEIVTNVKSEDDLAVVALKVMLRNAPAWFAPPTQKKLTVPPVVSPAKR
ncbi:MAG TPA: hypothetical protein VHH73_12025 [Verrucomicrobiae bacterium]|nr:hypothetical protein [Verrucomicrobiae bacterium]